MRMWSIHPMYLDTKGIVACWRESLLGQSCLVKGEYTEVNGNIRHRTAYYNHPQLNRFKESNDKVRTIGDYLLSLAHEADYRNFKFDKSKIFDVSYFGKSLTVTNSQLIYEFNHLQDKLYIRDKKKYEENFRLIKENVDNIQAHPLFNIIDGPIEQWERVK